MTSPLDTIKKMKGRSWEEIRARGGQALSAYSEQFGFGDKVPTDKEFYGLIQKSHFPRQEVSPCPLWDAFFSISQTSFFPSFAEREKTVELFNRFFSDKTARAYIAEAERIVDGRFNLLGYKNLHFGEDVDWHYEPIAKKRSPLQHWKRFDELDASETGDKKIIWELNRHQHFFVLGVAYWLTGEERFAATFVRHLKGWMRQNPPGMGINWASSLEISFRAISWIWAFHFFKDSRLFMPGLMQKAMKYLYLHGRHIEKYLSTFYSPNTHLTGEALGLYYLGTQLPFFERAAHWREMGESILFDELDRQISDDGVYFEQSTWYQRYTTDFYTHFLILKTLAEDGTSPRKQEKLATKLQAALDFLMYITRPDGTTPVIGDDDGGRMLPLSVARADDFRGSLAAGAVLFSRGDYKFVARELTEEVVWLFGLEGVLGFETLRPHQPNSNSTAFTVGGYYLMRDGWTETDNYMLVDGGNHGALSGGHSHADALSIDLAVGGRTLLVDSGTYTYHESNALRDYFRSSQAHNTLTIDEKSSSAAGGKFSWQTRSKTRVKHWLSQERFDYFEASHDGYERLTENPATHTRSILFLKNDYWIMRDYVETTGEHSYGLNFHFNAETNPAIESAENGIFTVNETPSAHPGLSLVTFGDNGGWQRKESWISNCYGEKINAPFLRFVSKGVGAQEFFTFLLPTDAGAEKPEVFETPVADGRAFAVRYRNYWDLFVFADQPGKIIRTEMFNTDFRFLWARLSAGDQLPEEFVMIGGTHFSLGGREIVNYPNQLNFAVARRLGNKMNVRTSESVFSISLPSSRSSNMILKNME